MWILLSLIGLAITAAFPIANSANLAFIGTAAALALGGAALGGVAGAMGSKKESSAGLNMKPASELENSAFKGLGSDFSSLRDMMAGGPNSADYSAGTQAQRDFAAQLKKYSEGGNMPTDADLANSNVFAQRAFDPQRVQMQQGFEDQKVEASRLSASLGRSVDDPILQAKLRTEMMRQQTGLNAQQGAFANEFAMQMPGQRLAYAGQSAGLMDEIGQRASANRQLLMSLGSSILGNERSFRSQTADRWGKESSGGGLGGAISGMLGGAGAGMSAFTAGKGAGMWGGNTDIGQAAYNTPMPTMPTFGSSIPRQTAASPFSFTPKSYGLGANTNLGF
jgi:hypothetical protein